MFQKNIGWSQQYTLSLCKISIRILDRNNKKTDLGAWTVSLFFPKFVQFFFSSAYTTRYFVFKICKIVVYTFGYLWIFVLNFIKLWNFNFSKFQKPAKSIFRLLGTLGSLTGAVGGCPHNSLFSMLSERAASNNFSGVSSNCVHEREMLILVQWMM
jgi:hypothetical protein